MAEAKFKPGDLVSHVAQEKVALMFPRPKRKDDDEYGGYWGNRDYPQVFFVIGPAPGVPELYMVRSIWRDMVGDETQQMWEVEMGPVPTGSSGSG